MHRHRVSEMSPVEKRFGGVFVICLQLLYEHNDVGSEPQTLVHNVRCQLRDWSEESSYPVYVEKLLVPRPLPDCRDLYVLRQNQFPATVGARHCVTSLRWVLSLVLSELLLYCKRKFYFGKSQLSVAMCTTPFLDSVDFCYYHSTNVPSSFIHPSPTQQKLTSLNNKLAHTCI